MMKPALYAPFLLLFACQAPVLETADEAAWQRHRLSEGHFSGGPGYNVAVPPGVKRVAVQGIDSQVAHFTAPGVRIIFDYGSFGGLASCDARWRCAEGELTVDGRTARTLNAEFTGNPPAPGERYGYFLYVPVHPEKGLALNLYMGCATREACAWAGGIADTIDFD